ncbi:MAG TPA: 50S ribosomal protein L23 [Chloroflexia bacterium]|nr:50S ribosomal protein L23 [Chloroflexia bacterium]
MNKYQVIKRPLVTERTNELIEQGVYTFEVERNANKGQIREAVESIFNVKVVGVNTLRMHRKQRGRGRFAGYTQVSKKAIVRLQPGDKIDIFETA